MITLNFVKRRNNLKYHKNNIMASKLIDDGLEVLDHLAARVTASAVAGLGCGAGGQEESSHQWSSTSGLLLFIAVCGLYVGMLYA